MKEIKLSTEEKNLAISCAIQIKVEQNGMTVKEAYDSIFGAGSYDEMAGIIYDSLRVNVKA